MTRGALRLQVGPGIEAHVVKPPGELTAKKAHRRAARAPHCPTIPRPFIPCTQPSSEPSMSWHTGAGAARPVQETHAILHRPIPRHTHHQIHHATSLTRRFAPPIIPPISPPIFVGSWR